MTNVKIMTGSVPGLLVLLILISALCMRCGSGPGIPELVSGKPLPAQYSNPDGLALGPDNHIYAVINNVDNPDHPARIIRITPDDGIEEVIDLLPHPETGVARPLGITFGPDGNLYVADNQSFATSTPGASRILRVIMNDGVAEKCEVVAIGFNQANGLATLGNSIYVTETSLNTGYPLKSGVYKLDVPLLSAENPLVLTGQDDPRLIVTIETQNQDQQVGANGLTFDSKGTMYLCNFGDAEIYRIQLDVDGNVLSNELWTKGNGIESCDGLHADEDDDLWLADFLGNAIIRISTIDGKVDIIAKNGQTDGANGELDAPSKCIRRGDRIYVSNIDLTYGANTYDAVQTLPVAQLE